MLFGSKENLHFDHGLPYSKGGTSFSANNVKILFPKGWLRQRKAQPAFVFIKLPRAGLQKSDKILSFPPIFFS